MQIVSPRLSRNSIDRDDERQRKQKISLRRDRAGVLILGMFLVSLMTLCGATFTVTNTADNGPGTLRQAILDANANLGLDTVAFNISGAGVHTLSPTNLLPVISDPIIIDGYTQPGASPNTLTNGDDAVLLIELEGSAAPAGDGLTIAAGQSTVRGLTINRFWFGICLSDAGSNVLAGNFIGTDPSGSIARPNGTGIRCLSGSANLIGGATPDARNIVSGSQGIGIYVEPSPSASNGVIMGNFVGTDSTGLARLGNAVGIAFSDLNTNWTIGGVTGNARNVVSGNEEGVELAGQGTHLIGNAVGVGSDGRSPVPNTNAGVFIFTGSHEIGGVRPGEGNVIAFNGGDGLFVSSDGNAVLGNSIFANGGLGIDLVANLKANNLQPSPTLTSAIIDTDTALSGTLTNSFSPSYRLEFFASTGPGQRASGEGEVFLGSADVATDFDGKAIFTVEVGTRDFNRPWITSTATDADGNTSEFSAAVLVQSTAGPIIQWPPTNQIGRAASNITFSVVASGLGPLAYQWRFQGAAIQGATNATLLLTNIQLANDGPYSVVVSNARGWVESNPVTLTVYERPVILQQPQDHTAVQGDNVSFAVVAMGGPPPLKYIWRFNSQSIAVETNPVLVLKNVQSTNAGGYKVGISTLGGTTLSANAVLTVLADIDGDHMPDAWEVANNLNPNDPSDASMDPDGDGMTNLQEYIAGTDPRSAQSYLKVDQISFGAGGAQISFLAVSNRSYRLLYKRSLDDPVWLTAADVPSRTTNSVALLNDPSGPSQRFYRLEVTP